MPRRRLPAGTPINLIGQRAIRRRHVANRVQQSGDLASRRPTDIRYAREPRSSTCATACAASQATYPQPLAFLCSRGASVLPFIDHRRLNRAAANARAHFSHSGRYRRRRDHQNGKKCGSPERDV